MSVPTVSVIISVFGQLQYTKRCLAQLEETLAGKLDYEVLIIDDAGKDGTIEFLQDLGEGYRVFFNEENQGFARTTTGSQGGQEGNICVSSIMAFSFKGGPLRPMLRVFEQKEKVGMVGKRAETSRRYDHMGSSFSSRKSSPLRTRFPSSPFQRRS